MSIANYNYMFAIGSNNNLEDLFTFIDSLHRFKTTDYHDNITFIGSGVLKDYRLQLNSFSYKRGSMGVANVIQSVGCKAYGGVFKISGTNMISKRDFIESIRTKERYPNVYNEAVRDVTVKHSNGKTIIYSCFFYYIPSTKILHNPLQLTFPMLPLPTSNHYFSIILQSFINYKFDTEIINKFIKIGELNSLYRNIVNRKLNKIHTCMLHAPFKLVGYLKQNYNNAIYSKEEFICDPTYINVLIIIAIQYIIKYKKGLDISCDIYDNINANSLEFKMLLDLHQVLLDFDKKLLKIQRIRL